MSDDHREIEGEVVARSDDAGSRPRRRIGRRQPEEPTPAAPTTELASVDSHGDLIEDDREPATVDPREDVFAERQVSTLFILGDLGAIGLHRLLLDDLADHTTSASTCNFALGGSLALSCSRIGAGMVVWAKKLLPHEKAIQERHAVPLPRGGRAPRRGHLPRGRRRHGSRRYKLLRRTLLGALGVLPLPAIVLLRDLGPLPSTTGWSRPAGRRACASSTSTPGCR